MVSYMIMHLMLDTERLDSSFSIPVCAVTLLEEHNKVELTQAFPIVNECELKIAVT